jgi:exopolysaccharide biosynthesis predicted pyruvyltransferase EpsI
MHALREPFEELAQVLRSRAVGKRVVFLQTDGNYGDALIRFGTECFFEDAGLDVDVLDMGSRWDKVTALLTGFVDRLKDRVLFVYSGGGGWARVCTVALCNVRRQLRVSPDVIVLPSTVQLCDLPRVPTLFVRDRFESRAALPDAPFCHDMAFYLATIDPDRVLPGRREPRERLGIVFRTDNESRVVGPSSHPKNFDLSAAGTHRDDARAFLRYLDRFEHVLTDRLHVGIGATLLGKDVSLVNGNYFKIRSIFKSSIEPFFPNCRLVEDAQVWTILASAASDRGGEQPPTSLSCLH